MLDYRNLVVLVYSSNICYTTLYEIDENLKIVSRGKYPDSMDRVKYVSQGFELDLNKNLYRTIFGADRRGSYIKNGFVIKDGWNQIGDSVIPQDHGDGLIGIYDRTNFEHLSSMLSASHHATEDRSHED